MILFDRLENKEVQLKDIEQPILFARYIILSNQDNIVLNEEKYVDNLFFVPSNNLNILIDDGKEINKISFYPNNLITDRDSLLINTFLEITEELEITENLKEMDEVSPLLRNFDKRLEITEFDEFVNKYLFHLEEICREPSYHLSREITKVNIARAKRIPVRAINYLASHSEDWASRKIRTVQPNKVLAEIIEYDLQIYENRVTTTLIDALLQYFSNKLVNDIVVIEEFIEKIEKIIESRSSYNNESKFWYKKLERDYLKLGNVVGSVENSKSRLDKTKNYIQNIRKRLFSLLTSDMYRSNINNKIVTNLIERTNLFDNHQHYRYVKLIWNKIYKNESKSYSTIAIEHRKTINSFFDFSWLLIVQALSQIGFKENKKIGTKHYILKSSKFPFFDIEICETERKNIEIKLEEEMITFIPFPSNHVCSENINNIYYITMNKSIKDSDTIIQVSPEEINSVDRVTKVLFTKIFSKFIEKYKTSFINNKDVFSTCIACGKNGTLDDGLNGFKFSCSNKDCKIEYGFHNKGEQSNFYRVKDYEKIINNTNDIENRIGYEHIG